MTSHYLNQYWPNSLTRICGTRGRWIKLWSHNIIFRVTWCLKVRPSTCCSRYRQYTSQIHSHYSDIIIGLMVSQITGVSIVCSTVCSGADQRNCQSSASLAFVRGIHWWLVNSPHKGPAMQKMFPFDDVIMISHNLNQWWPSSLVCIYLNKNNFPNDISMALNLTQYDLR